MTNKFTVLIGIYVIGVVWALIESID